MRSCVCATTGQNRHCNIRLHSAAFGCTRHRAVADLADLGTSLAVAWIAGARRSAKDIARAALQAARG
jgi:hypothetical protein